MSAHRQTDAQTAVAVKRDICHTFTGWPDPFDMVAKISSRGFAVLWGYLGVPAGRFVRFVTGHRLHGHSMSRCHKFTWLPDPFDRVAKISSRGFTVLWGFHVTLSQSQT